MPDPHHCFLLHLQQFEFVQVIVIASFVLFIKKFFFRPNNLPNFHSISIDLISNLDRISADFKSSHSAKENPLKSARNSALVYFSGPEFLSFKFWWLFISHLASPMITVNGVVCSGAGKGCSQHCLVRGW